MSFINLALPHAIYVAVDLLFGVFANSTRAEVPAEFSGKYNTRLWRERENREARAANHRLPIVLL